MAKKSDKIMSVRFVDEQGYKVCKVLIRDGWDSDWEEYYSTVCSTQELGFPIGRVTMVNANVISVIRNLSEAGFRFMFA